MAMQMSTCLQPVYRLCMQEIPRSRMNVFTPTKMTLAIHFSSGPVLLTHAAHMHPHIQIQPNMYAHRASLENFH